MFLRQIFDAGLAQNAYLIGCQRTGEAIVFDPLRDVDRYLRLAEENDLRLTAAAETHIHADFLSGARELVETHGATAYVSGLGGADWQSEWADGNPRVRILRDGETFMIGNIEIEAVHTPGHTPEHLSFLVTDRGGGADQPGFFLTGDFIFVGDVGRPDLLESAAGVAGMMEPSARTLRASLRATNRIPAHVQVLPAHGAGSACGKALGAVPSSVLGYERLFNAPLRIALEENEDRFVSDILHGQPEPPLYFARMKRDNKTGPRVLGSLPEPARLSQDELEEVLDGESTWLLDLRRDTPAYLEKHVVRSLHCPLDGVTLSMVAGSYIEEDEKIIVLTEDPAELEEAVRQLVRIGLDRVVGWMPVEEALAWAEAHGRIKKIRSVAAGDLPRDEGAILDVRSIAEHAAGAVPGAVNIAYTRLRARREEIPAGAPLYVHCATGRRASFAVSYLESLDREVIRVDGSAAGAARAA